MAEVDRYPEKVVEFCKKFEKEYLSVLRENARKLKMEASSVTATLGSGTMMSTKASEKMTEAADKMLKAAEEGEQRIREIEKKAQEQVDHLEQFGR